MNDRNGDEDDEDDGEVVTVVDRLDEARETLEMLIGQVRDSATRKELAEVLAQVAASGGVMRARQNPVSVELAEWQEAIMALCSAVSVIGATCASLHTKLNERLS